MRMSDGMRTPLIEQLYKLPYVGFPMKDKEWDDSTPEQREQWKQQAIEMDKKANEIKSQIHAQYALIHDALKAVWGYRENYKGKPINSNSKQVQRLWKYLWKDNNSPLQRLQGHKYYQNLWDNYNNSYQKRKQELERTKLQDERNRKLKEQEVEKIKTLTEICIRHEIDTALVPDAYEIQEELLKKDKYLALGMGGLRTRQDWSDGFYKAEYAFDAFVVETDIDKAIQDDWSSIFSGYLDDGRYFRDTEWNYNKLFGLVENQQLYTDAMTVEEYLT